MGCLFCPRTKDINLYFKGNIHSFKKILLYTVFFCIDNNAKQIITTTIVLLYLMAYKTHFQFTFSITVL